jgi:pSer/pThr/pTyr-binding forkhead associated (FHA) protein
MDSGATIKGTGTFLLLAENGSVTTINDSVVVGRDAACDLVINDGRISRKHAELRLTETGIEIEDFGSINGTQLNGVSIEGVVSLAHGDTISFNHTAFSVQDSSAAEEVDSGATIIGMAPIKITPPETVKAEEKTSSAALPGSWVESGASEGTQILSSITAADLKVLPASTSESPQLIAYGDGGEQQVFDLTITDGPGPDVWEIGRIDSCDIVLDDPSVSSRHAQLIHQGGRWKIVNLVSTNGLFINGEKKLTAYLGNGDDILIGIRQLAFSLGTVDSSVNKKSIKPKAEKSRGLIYALAAGVAVVIIIALTLVI